MVQMFGPQWTEKFGANNAAWEEALRSLGYSEISIGLNKVMRGALKFYEIDLPRFLELCKPPPAKPVEFQMEIPSTYKLMCEKERDMHFFANRKMLVWCVRHPKLGINGPGNFTKEQNKQLYVSARRISHDFFMMREELGDEAIPQDDFLQALHLSWERIAPLK